jgi:hypothetical protein
MKGPTVCIYAAIDLSFDEVTTQTMLLTLKIHLLIQLELVTFSSMKGPTVCIYTAIDLSFDEVTTKTMLLFLYL